MSGLPLAAAMTPAPGQNGGAATLIFVGQIALIFVIFYFLLIRPQRQQQKRHEEMLKTLKRGDEVVTSGGVVGEIIHVKDDRLTIRSGESKLIVERERIAKVIPKAEAAPAS